MTRCMLPSWYMPLTTCIKSKCIKYDTCWRRKIKSLLPLDGHLQFQAQGSGVQVFSSSWLTQNISPTVEFKLNTHSPLITFHFQVQNLETLVVHTKSRIINEPGDHDGAIKIHWLVCFPMAITNAAKLGSGGQIRILACTLAVTFCIL